MGRERVVVKLMEANEQYEYLNEQEKNRQVAILRLTEQLSL